MDRRIKHNFIASHILSSDISLFSYIFATQMIYFTKMSDWVALALVSWSNGEWMPKRKPKWAVS
ncbi:hypothetical protein KSC_019860 [Ktedonobacter sp. SOSP1-52]|nr:hypothetical protein KSC_019860 [Ktedonobacter sp. SOSP1-52]